MLHDPPTFGPDQFTKALNRLGFKNRGKARHGYKFEHPTKIPVNALKPFLIVPRDLKKDKDFQKALAGSLIKHWGFTEREVLEALK